VELAGAHLLVSVEMKKSWAKKPTYWIEIYGKHGAGMKIVRFYVWRQWSFVKGSMFDTNREVVEGGYLIPNFMTSFMAAVDAAVEVAEKQVQEKGYEVANVLVPEEVDSAPWGLQVLSQGIASCVHRMKSIKKTTAPTAQLEMPIGDEKRQQRLSDRSKKEDFWDTARQREKKSKW
jgi:hypothetical protein